MVNTKIVMFFILLLLVISIPFSYADEPKTGFSVGSQVVLESSKSGGALELSFPLYSKGAFFIRNAIVLSGFSSEPDGIIAAGDKIMAGGRGWNNTATYGFVYGAAGTMKNSIDDFFELPLYLEFKLGGGFEIYSSARNAFAVEAGGGISIVSEELEGFAHLAVMYRVYVN